MGKLGRMKTGRKSKSVVLEACGYDEDSFIAMLKRGELREKFGCEPNLNEKPLTASMPMSVQPIGVRVETADFIITGRGWSLKKLADGEKAFANRNYIWQGVPKRFYNWSFTQFSGGESIETGVKAKHDFELLLATTTKQTKVNLSKWTPVPALTFYYTDACKTKMSIFSRGMKADDEAVIPQDNWTGGLLLLPPNIED